MHIYCGSVVHTVGCYYLFSSDTASAATETRENYLTEHYGRNDSINMGPAYADKLTTVQSLQVRQ